MNFIGTLLQGLERSSAGSEETAKRVMELCGDISPKSALFVGDDYFTPKLMNRTCRGLTAAFTEDYRAERAAEEGLDSCVVQLFELPKSEGGFEFIWYNGTVEFDGVTQRLNTLKERSGKGIVVYRALCWLIEPMPDTRLFYERRFGIIEQMYTVTYKAKELGFVLKDFYIAPKSDWRDGYYKPLNAAAREFGNVHPDSSDVSAGLVLLDKEIDMFERHGEEFSYIYFILENEG
ncbi:MAG: hypothetical protein K2G32_04285 [Oscillospiraceae bacterium]|nr:hypothetical protein [Oscillospiraceae bacterium]